MARSAPDVAEIDEIQKTDYICTSKESERPAPDTLDETLPIVGKEYMISDKAFVNLAATSGFLCWQTSLCGQNDAVMYGLAANCRINDVELKTYWGGYVGWRKENDCPMTLRTEFLLHRKFCDFRLHYQKGLIDWPYSQIALSLILHFGKPFKKISMEHPDPDSHFYVKNGITLDRAFRRVLATIC
ncbi:MAG: hypothetical protein ACI3ZK_02320 [Candidatus Cryptobacteroides sp.]